MKHLPLLLASVIVVASFAATYLYSSEYGNLAAKYNSLSSENQTLSNDTRKLLSENSYLRAQLNMSAITYHDLLENYTKKGFVYQTPGQNTTIDIWTRATTVGSQTWKYWALLDTFDNHIRLTTNSTATVFIMDIDNYVGFVAGKPFSTIYNSTGLTFIHDESIAEGCGAYVLVILNKANSTILLSPDITATFAPAPFLTGVCGL